jgi:hypothetical protein
VGVDYDKLQMTEEGEYSVTKRKDGEKIIGYIRSVVHNLKQKHITDLTGNVGGDTILFGLNFKKVDSIELKPTNFAALENNVKVFGLKNVTLHQGDSTKLYRWQTDVLYIDPPWGGPDYKNYTSLDLFLGTERVDLFIRDIFNQSWAPDYIFMKAPANYNFDRLADFDYEKFKVRTFYLICLFPPNE